MSSLGVHYLPRFGNGWYIINSTTVGAYESIIHEYFTYIFEDLDGNVKLRLDHYYYYQRDGVWFLASE